LFGRTTDSDDVTGETLTEFSGELPTFETIRTQSEPFLGKTMQTPPNYSARKVDGQRLYRLARKGQTVEAPAKEIEVSSWEWIPNDGSDLHAAPLGFKMAVSSGTYVRSLARDLGARLGCGATLATLRRTEIGPLSISTAISPPDKSVREWHPTELVPMAKIPLQLPQVVIDDDRIAADFRSGRSFELELPEAGDWIRVDDPSGSLLGVAERSETGWQPRVVIDAR
jgi:tRNA pseudouridine55 synthase